jgi:S-formylglutathione hydrolase FrmB
MRSRNLAALILAGFGAAAIVAGWAPQAVAAGAGDIHVVSSKHLDRRLVQLELRTPALTHDTGVRVLLPDGYRDHPRRRYPVLYLLHGSGGSDTDWTELGNAEKITAGSPLIVVMPDTDQNGYYSDWFNNGAGGPPEYETYDIGELIPWIDQRYRAVAARRGRAIAGLSMGGFGALSYASRHPDLFNHVAGFSPASDTNYAPFQALMETGTSDGDPTINTWGPYATQEVIWRGHNPWDLARNLRGMSISLRYGNGDRGGPYGGGDPIEAGVHAMTVGYSAKLTRLHMPHINDDYGPGGHTWPYWKRDLRQELPLFMRDFRNPLHRPRSVGFKAIEPRYEIFGWHVAVKRKAPEFSTLSRATPHGFRLAGSGSAAVRTPARYAPGERFAVHVRPEHGKPLVERLRASRSGRLRIHVPLGPANPDQEYTQQAQFDGGTEVFTTRARIARASGS